MNIVNKIFPYTSRDVLAYDPNYGFTPSMWTEMPDGTGDVYE